MLSRPTAVDPEVAAATFNAHLEEFWATGRPEKSGWGKIQLDSLHAIVALPGIRPDGTRDWYFVKLGAEFYDAWPVMVEFVNPADWSEAKTGTRWFPGFAQNPDWFSLHAAYSYPDGVARQLVCFTLSAQYYMVDHSPPETTVWRQGRHTVAATLIRLAEVLQAPYYQKPTG